MKLFLFSDDIYNGHEKSPDILSRLFRIRFKGITFVLPQHSAVLCFYHFCFFRNILFLYKLNIVKITVLEQQSFSIFYVSLGLQ